ncbi:MAG: alcohol dehydrogenase catalytic domain-containing protein [Clostridia bacterium]|nr:alcohol dehydrogenase catalytic domain-containing protein [Clostridia bacterium]
MWNNESESNIMVVGHRGMRDLFPENTMISFAAALDAGVDLIEFDVHLTKDGIPVVCHDGNVRRTTDGEGEIKDMTLEELKKLDAGIKKHTRFAGEKIPTLEEVLTLMKNAPYEVLLNVEIKPSDHKVVDKTIAMLRKFGLAERSVIACFDAEIIRYTKSTYPEMKTQGFPGRYMSNFTEDTYECMYGIGIPINWGDCSDESIKADVEMAKSKGLMRWLFCADNEDDVAKCVKLGCTNVTGNDPMPAIRYLAKMGLRKAPEHKFPKNMTAISLHAVGDLVTEERQIPEIGEDEVLVNVKNCGICGSDIGRVFKNGTYHFPTVIGHEFAGKVVLDKSGEWTGRRVSVFPLLPCFNCEACKAQNYACCANYDYYGSRRDGGFTQYIAVKKFNLVPLPDNVTYEEGAMCEPASVGCHAIKKLNIKGSESILISGAGPIGIIAARWAMGKGAASVKFIENDPAKIDFAKKLGFMIHNEGEKYDCAIEGTGASAPLSMILRAVKTRGKVVLMGNPSCEINLAPNDYQQILRSELQLLGTWNSSYADLDNDWRDTLEAVSKGELIIRDLITHRFPLADTLKGLTMMRDKKEFFVKVMTDNDK